MPSFHICLSVHKTTKKKKITQGQSVLMFVSVTCPIFQHLSRVRIKRLIKLTKSLDINTLVIKLLMEGKQSTKKICRGDNKPGIFLSDLHAPKTLIVY